MSPNRRTFSAAERLTAAVGLSEQTSFVAYGQTEAGLTLFLHSAFLVLTTAYETQCVRSKRGVYCRVLDCETLVAVYVRGVPLCMRHAVRLSRNIRRNDGSLEEILASAERLPEASDRRAG